MADAINDSIPSGNVFSFDMRPPAGILNVFSRLNYKPHYAIAEFVDNSTQSYLLHKDQLVASGGWEGLQIDIRYDPDDGSLVITDNAFGMERDRFLDAITLDAKNSDQVDSRNEFGMGLKTAASWFGNVWTVSSTQLGSDKRYFAKVDIPFLHSSGESNIDVVVGESSPSEHGTTIAITDITKHLGPRSVGKIRSMLGSMYRRDLCTGDVEISFNGGSISFDGYPVLSFRDREWKKPLDFSFEFGGVPHRVTGFVGIMNPGSFVRAGFALFRRNRVVIGGEDHNYKPKELFGESQSQVSLKLFGELNLEDFPINQAKDGFIWDDGLEDEFIEALRSNIREFIEIARMSTKERTREEMYNPEASERVERAVKKNLSNFSFDEEPPQSSGDADASTTAEQKDGYDPEGFKADYINALEEENKAPTSILDQTRDYELPINPVSTINVTVRWEIGNNDRWFDLTRHADDGSIDVAINVNHPFFKPYSNEEEFQVVLEKFVIAFILSEEKARLTADRDGYILADSIRNNMNRMLKEFTR